MFKLTLHILFNYILISILDSIVGVKYSFFFWKKLWLSDSFTKEEIDTFYLLLNKDFNYNFETGNIVIEL